VIGIKEKQKCCGCAACVAVCSGNCIEMKEDVEGFFYPEIDKNKCVECKACEKVCPILNKQAERIFNQKAYIVQNKDEQVLRESTAGGAFTAIAEYVLSHAGVVFGVELNSDFVAQHICIEEKSEIYRFRNSKYVQSYLGGDIHQQVKFFLEQGRMVCFSGTPCQIEGLKKYLKQDYEKLITVDVVCRAVPSPLIFQKYVEYQEHNMAESIKTVRFRDKHYGYKYSTMNVITDRNQGNYHKGVESDPWLRAFFSNICDRPSCHSCHFRNQYRVSDFTIWDCFHVGRFSKELDNDKGATRVLVHTDKGGKVFDEIKSKFHYIQTTPEAIVNGVREMEESVLPHVHRQAFFEDAKKMNGVQLFQKYFPETFQVKVKHGIRLICYKLRIYGMIKKMYVRIMHKY